MGIWYRLGTVSIANGDTTVTGVGTAWVNEILAGDAILFAGSDKAYEVAVSPSTNTSLELSVPFAETTLSGATYQIIRLSPERSLVPSLAVKVAAVLARQNALSAHTTGIFSVMSYGASEANTEADNRTALEAAIAACDAAGGGVVEVPWPIDYGFDRVDKSTYPDFSACTSDMMVIDRGRGSTHDAEGAPAKEGFQERIFYGTAQTTPKGQHDGNGTTIAADWHPYLWLENTAVYAAQGHPSRASDDNLRTSIIYGYDGVPIWQLGMGQTKVGDVSFDDMFHYVISAWSLNGSTRLTPLIINYLNGAMNYSTGSILTKAAHWFKHEPLVGQSVATMLIENAVTEAVLTMRNSVSGDVDVTVQNNAGVWDFKAPTISRAVATGSLPAAPPTGSQAYDTTIGGPVWFDGSAWKNAVGAVGAGGREGLIANRIYYVRTDGSDSNTGLADSAGGAFLTVQKAVDVACSLDAKTFNVTITARAGTFAGLIALGRYVGTGVFSIIGAGATTILSSTGNTIVGNNAGAWLIDGVKVTSSGGSGILARGLTSLTIGSVAAIEFGAVSASQLRCDNSASIRIFAYTISGAAVNGWWADMGGRITCTSVTVTITGTPAFTRFAQCDGTAQMLVSGITFSGSATGERFQATLNAIINTGGGGATYLPGNAAAGSPTLTGGQYA